MTRGLKWENIAMQRIKSIEEIDRRFLCLSSYLLNISPPNFERKVYIYWAYYAFSFQTTCHSLENKTLRLSCIHIHVSSHAQPFQTTCYSLENKILCLICIHIHVSSHAQPLNKEMILKERVFISVKFQFV